MSADRFVEFAFALLIAALLILSSPTGSSSRALARDDTTAGTFRVAEAHKKDETAEERKRRLRQKAKQQQRQKAKQEQRQKAKQEQRQKAKQERKRLQAQEQRQKEAKEKPKQKKRLNKLRQKAQEGEDRKELRRQKAQDRERLNRQKLRILRAKEERRKTRRRAAVRNEQQLKRLKLRRRALRGELNQEHARAERRARRGRRLDRQRAWERRQVRPVRRRFRRDFGFHRSARVVRRRNDRIIYAGLAAAAVGVAAGALFVYHDDDVRFGWHARDVRVEPMQNGWTRTVVVRPNGVRICTVRDSNGFIVRRYRVRPGNQITFLFNNQPSWWEDDALYVDVEPVSVGIPQDRYIVEPSYAPVEAIYETVTAAPVDELDRTYTLNQILVNARLRDYMPRIDLDTITFAPGSAQVPVDQIGKLEAIGVAIEQAIMENTDEVYLLEGHTDATGSDVANLELSDRRAEAVANVLTEYFEIPPEHLVTQGYGEQFLKIGTQGPEQRNRRVGIRRITPLLSKESDQIAFDDDGNEIIEAASEQ